MKRTIILLLLGLTVLSACQGLDPKTTATVTPDQETTATSPTASPTHTEIPLQRLTVCTTDLPESLFFYDGVQTPVKNNILALISEPPFAMQNGELAPVILEKIPNLGDGDLRLEPVSVEAGQPVVDAAGEVAVLKPGLEVRPSGCQSADCVITWEGETPLEMDQMAVEFQLAPGLTWSDGAPVRAADSVFSFNIASDDDAPGLQWAESRTESYVALDETRIQWTGLPGFSTAALDQIFWRPLTSHLFANTAGWSDIVNDERIRTSPLSFGPFVLKETGEQSMRFVANPTYFRGAEGLPLLDEVVFQEVAGGATEAASLLGSGACDVLDSSFNWLEFPNLLDQVRSLDRFFVKSETGASWMQLVFGIQPAASVADGTDGKLPLLGDVRTRQAISACLNRESMLDNTIGDLGDMWQSFLPPEDSQLTEGERLAYDPSKGAELLTSVGWVDHDGEPATSLQAQGVIGVPFGTSLSLELLISPSGFQQDLAQAIQRDLGACGIEVSLTTLPAENLYVPGAEGPLFGRQFDLALIAWQPLPQEDCQLYDSTQIPSAENYWIGTNIAGLSDQVYDDACRTASLALPVAREEALYEAEKVFLSQLPAIPLFSLPKVMVLPANTCESGEIVKESDFFEQLEEYQFGQGCQ